MIAAGGDADGPARGEQPGDSRGKQGRDSAAPIGNKSLAMGEIQQDPSMEEILASIKRVIAEDGRASSPRSCTPIAARSTRT